MRKVKTIYELIGNYKKADVDLVLAALSEEDKRLIELRYKSFKGEVVWTDENAHQFYRLLIPRIRRQLEKPLRRPKSIYEYFKEYSKDDVDNAIMHLSDEYKKVLLLRYGEDLRNPSVLSSKWEGKHITLFHNHILVDINKYLINKTTGRKIKTIYELLDGYTKEEIDRAIAELDFEDKELLRKRYGDNLEIPNASLEWETSLSKPFYRLLLPKIKQIIKKQNKNIYSYFPDYTYEQVDDAIKLLDTYSKAELVLCFNYDLLKTNNVSLNGVKITKYTPKYIIKKISIRLKKLFGGNKIKTIYDYFEDCNKEDVDRAISKLSKGDRELLYLKFNGDLEMAVKNPEWSSVYSKKFYEIVNKISRILNGGTQIHSITIYDYFPAVTEEQLNAILVNLSLEEKELLYLKYGTDLHNPEKTEYWSGKYSSRFGLLVRRLDTKIKNMEEFEELLSFEEDVEFQEIINYY